MFVRMKVFNMLYKLLYVIELFMCFFLSFKLMVLMKLCLFLDFCWLFDVIIEVFGRVRVSLVF